MGAGCVVHAQGYRIGRKGGGIRLKLFYPYLYSLPHLVAFLELLTNFCLLGDAFTTLFIFKGPTGHWFRRKAAVELGILWWNWRLRRGYSLVMLAGLAGVPPTKVSPYLLQSTSFYHPSTPITSTIPMILVVLKLGSTSTNDPRGLDRVA